MAGVLGRTQVFAGVLALLGSIGVTAGPAGSARAMPASFVAESGGRIVVVSAGTGRIERHLTAAKRGASAVDPALTPDGRTVWFSVRRAGKCAAHLASVPVEGGQERPVPGSGDAGPEQRPAPRPGHDQIAFSRTDCEEASQSLVVGDVDGLEGYGQTGYLPLEWNRDGTRLLADTADGRGVHLLTVNPNGAIVGAEALNPPNHSDECRLQVVGFSSDDNDGYVAVRRCGRPGENARRSLILLDRSGQPRRIVVRLPRGRDFVDRIAFDRRGHSLLYSTIPSELGKGDGQPEVTLWAWRDGKARRVIRSSPYRQPSWLP